MGVMIHPCPNKTKIPPKEDIPMNWPVVYTDATVPNEFPAQRASNAENISIWWRHYDNKSGC